MHTTDKRQAAPRQRTYHSDKGDGDSRIDDAFISENLSRHCTPVTNVLNHRGDSYRDPLMVKIPLTCIKFLMPGPDPVSLPGEPKLKTPIPIDLLQKFTEEFNLEMGADIALLNAKLDHALETALQQVDALAPNKSIKEKPSWNGY